MDVLDAALKKEAVDTFSRAVSSCIDLCSSSKQSRSAILAIDTSLSVIFELLATGEGGPKFYDQLRISQLISLPTYTMDAYKLRRQVDGALASHSDHPLVIFVVPPRPTLAKLIADVVRGPSGHISHPTSSPLHSSQSTDGKYALLWLPPSTSECSLEMERQGVEGIVTQMDLDLGLLPIDKRVSSLCNNAAFAELYVQRTDRVLTTVTKSILAIEKHTGMQIPNVISHGPYSMRVKRMLELSRQASRNSQSRESVTQVDPLNANLQLGDASSGAIQTVVMVDRLQDPLSILLHPMTYEGLLDALIGLDHGVVTYDKPDSGTDTDSSDSQGRMKKEDLSSSSTNASSTSVTKQKAVLNDSDELYRSIRDINFNLLISQELVNSARSLVSAVRSGESAATIEEIRDLLTQVPSLVQKKKSLAHHVALVEKIRDASMQQSLRGCIETEMLIMSMGRHKTTPEAKEVETFLEEAVLREPPLKLYEVVPLLCVWSLVTGGLKPKKLQWFRQQLCHTYGHKVLPLLVQLQKLELLSSKHDFNFHQQRKALTLMPGLLEDEQTKEPGDIHFMFPYTGYAPMSVRLVQNSVGMKIKSSAFSSGSGKDKDREKDKDKEREKEKEKEGRKSSGPLGLTRQFSASSLKPESWMHRRRPSDGGPISSNSYGDKRRSMPVIGGMRRSMAPAEKMNVLVYYVGGVTAAELAAFRYLNKSQSQITFLVATTSVCTGRKLLESI